MRRHGGACRPPQTPRIRSRRSLARPGNCRGPCRPGGHTGEATFPSPPGLGPLPAGWPLHTLLRPSAVPASLPAAPLGLLDPRLCWGFSGCKESCLQDPGALSQVPVSRVSFPSKPDCLCLKSVVQSLSLSLSFMSASASYRSVNVFLPPVLLHNLQGPVKAGPLLPQLLRIGAAVSQPEPLPRTGPWLLLR